MPAPGIVTGSNSVTGLFGSGSEASPSTSIGVFGANPGHTPKYAINRGRRDAEYKETMARLFVEVPTGLNTFLGSITPETQALARVLATGGSAAGSSGTGFLDFLLTSAQEPFAEKAQIVDTLTDNYVAFYAGQQPPLFSYSGTVLNTYQDDQRVWLFRLYREILRGTRLANRNLIARLRYDSFIVSGYLESLVQGITGDTDNSAGSFQFTLRVQHMTVFTPSVGAPTIAGTPATTVALATSAVTPQDPSTERVATITSDTPPTAPTLPGATPTAVTLTEADRQSLRDSGLSDTEIDALVQAARDTQGTASPDTDPREVAAAAAHAAAARMQDAITGTAGSTSSVLSAAVGAAIDLAVFGADINPDSLQTDGLGGITNVFGDVAGTIFGTESTDGDTFVQELPEREGARRRGGLSEAFTS